MEFKDRLISEMKRNGYSELEDGRKVWDISNRCFLYMTPELVSFFLQARNHQRYKENIIKIETNLLKENASSFIEKMNSEPLNLIDIGSVDGTKAIAFLKTLEGKRRFRFCPVSPSETLVQLSLKNVQDASLKNVSDFKPHTTNFNHLNEVTGMMRNGTYEKSLILLLESLLASFEIHEFLFKLSRAMLSGDALIIGNGIRVGERFANLETYKNKLFKEWFLPLVKELSFQEKDVEYNARFANGRVEGFFKVLKDKELLGGGCEVNIKKGDEIIVSVLYKYYERELVEYCKMYFREVKLVKDKQNEYALIFCKK